MQGQNMQVLEHTEIYGENEPDLSEHKLELEK